MQKTKTGISMKIFVAGDYCCQTPENISMSKQLADDVKLCDIKILNYEAPVEGQYNNLEPKSGPRLMQSARTVEWLKEYDFNLIATANNHLMDYGMDAYQKTRTCLKDFDLIGSGNWDEAYRMHIVEKEGIKIGFLNLCELQFGVLHDSWTQDKKEIGCAWINHPMVDNLIRECKQKVDFLIAITHAGLEMADLPLPEWRDRYRQMIDLGCDAIIGGHTHTIQGYEIYKNKPIFYSLGNFCFVSKSAFHTADWFTGSIVFLDIINNQLTFSYKGVVLKDNQISYMDENDWNKKLTQLNQGLSAGYIEKINQICSSKLRGYWELNAMGGLAYKKHKVFKGMLRWILNQYNEVHFLNNLQCETHRWCFARGIRQLIKK